MGVSHTSSRPVKLIHPRGEGKGQIASCKIEQEEENEEEEEGDMVHGRGAEPSFSKLRHSSGVRVFCFEYAFFRGPAEDPGAQAGVAEHQAVRGRGGLSLCL